MDWQPIATAPKDGTSFLAWGRTGPSEDGYFVCWWFSAKRGFWVCDGMGFKSTPTHWMPLPEPPK